MQNETVKRKKKYVSLGVDRQKLKALKTNRQLPNIEWDCTFLK